MSRNKHNYTITDPQALQAFCPKALITEIRHRGIRSVITKLLDTGITVPGLTLEPNLSQPHDPTVRPLPAADHTLPAFFGKQPSEDERMLLAEA
jgi:hypothetical protein